MTSYHWAIIVGPKVEHEQDFGMRYHAQQQMTTVGEKWELGERRITLMPSRMILVRILIGKVEDKERLVNIIRNTPIRHDQAGWNCVSWVSEVLQRLKADAKAMGTSILEWQQVRDQAMIYCQKKRDEHRFDGKGTYDSSKVPTYDLLERKEMIA